VHQDDVPAALPLIALTAGLLAGRHAVAFAVLALLLLALRRFRLALACLALASGAAIAAANASRSVSELRSFERFDPSRFVRIEAALDHDWARRGDVWALHLRQFKADGKSFAGPLTLYSRFAPQPILLHDRVTAEGFLRRNERNSREGWVMSLKSPRLVEYHGVLSPLDPSRWNRVAAARLESCSARYPDEVALAEALALGRSERLSDSMRDNFKRGGTYHLLVFSGLQIALAAALIAMLLRWLHAPRVADWSLLTFAIAAPLFIGPTASVWRASTSIGLFAVSRIARRPTAVSNLWCVSAMIRLAVAPADLADAAFQLTYAGAGAILFAGRPLATRPARWIAYALAAELTITPLTLFHFHQYSAGGSVTTMLMTPIVLAMLLIASLACAFPFDALFELIRLLDALCVRINSISAVASGIFAAPSLAAMAMGFAGAMLGIAFTRGRVRAAVILTSVAIPLLAALHADHQKREIQGQRLILLDVGQGDSILLRSGNHNLLVDGGPADTILPLLADRGVRKLDVVLLTHAHPDHCGGLVAVVDRLEVGSLWLSPRRLAGDCTARLLETARLRRTPIHLIRVGDSGTIGDIRFATLTADSIPRRARENNSSVVLAVQAERIRALLTGDIERETEAALQDRIHKCDILKIAHHGSRSSSTTGFLEKASPRLALISCGYHNLFGHPHMEVMEALRHRQIGIMRTDLSGTIELRLSQRRITALREIDTPR
jgi:competence protein ComEC